MFDVIVIGGSTRDLFFISPDYKVENNRLEFVWKEKFVVDKLVREVGGGGCNAAVGLARLGLRATLLSQVGDDPSGEQVARRLKEEGVDLRLLHIEPRGTTSTSILLASTEGEHAIVMYRGRNDELLSDPERWQDLGETSWLYLSDVSTADGDPSYEVAKFAKEKGIKLVFIPGQHQLKLGIGSLGPVLSLTEILILNAYEACLLFGEDFAAASESLIRSMLRGFLGRGVKIAVITKDLDGVYAAEGASFLRRPAPRIEKRVDTTGAGDAFAVGFVAARMKGKTVEESLDWGNRNAGSVIQQFGAQPGLLRLDEIAN